MSKNNKQLKSLCVCSVLAALYVALELIASYTGKIFFADSYQLPISCFPLIIASVMFGVFWGGMTGLVGSFISQLLLPFPISISTVLWMIPTVCYSISVAVLYLLFKNSRKPYIALSVELIISSLLLSFLNVIISYVNNYILDLSNALLALFLPVKIISAVISAIVFAIIVPPTVKKLKSAVFHNA